MLMIFLMSFSLGINSLMAVSPIEDIHGNIAFVYTEEEHRNVVVGFEELKQWRKTWPQFQSNYNTLADSRDIWKENYSTEVSKNYDLRVQRNVMLVITGSTIGGLIISLILGLIEE